MSEQEEPSRPVCQHPDCGRTTALDPPFCCLPCGVAARSDVDNLHSVTCNRRSPEAVECASVLWAGSRCSFSCSIYGLHPTVLHRCGSVEWDDLDAIESMGLWGPAARKAGEQRG